MKFADDPVEIKWVKAMLLLAVVILLLLVTALYGSGAEPLLVASDEAGTWAEIAYVRFQAAQGYEAQSDRRSQAAFSPRAPQDASTPGDNLELAGDEKFLACEEYQRAAKHWEKAAQGFRATAQLDKARSSRDAAAVARQNAKQTLVEATGLYRMAEQYYDTTNDLSKRSALLGKIARNLEQFVDLD